MHISRYHDLIDRIDGYTVGTLVIENGKAQLQTQGGGLALDDAQTIEVLNGDHYETFTVADCLQLKTDEGWPLLAGFYARVRF